ncbi:hypothetical protein GCM10009733_007300 [Nonomuraea maheshkhaliensis]|uniref:Aminoglycoside phosphotransferase domain-containing protein n=1 Tax=Nonomuraea maheshkhaliensis TaxID=419590 RepID=A0ABN2ER19_9ACTN
MTFTKLYASREELEQTLAHYTWLSRNAGQVRLPDIEAVHADRIDFASVEGRHAAIADAPAVAYELGRAHAATWTNDLHRADLTAAHLLTGGCELAGFVSPRVAALRRLRDAGRITAGQVAAVQPLLDVSPDTPVAFYKDTNPRNVLITGDGPVMIDFDSMSLAPFGYDLAKLLVTLAMTHGSLPLDTFLSTLAFYNSALIDAGLRPVPTTEVLGYAELHHLLTLSYLGRGGYQHLWPDVRPLPQELK